MKRMPSIVLCLMVACVPVLAAQEPQTAPDPAAGPPPAAADSVPERYHSAYLGQRPRTFLVDPQQLLGPLDTRERLDFLNYHAGDSAIDLFVYLFGAEQAVPAELRAEELVGRFFTEGRPAAVVYYFMGAPGRAELHPGPQLRAVLPGGERRRALESSVMQALKHAEPPRQFEAFLVQMSIRLYWMERMLGGAEEAEPSAAPQATRSVAEDPPPGLAGVLRPHLEDARRFALPAAAAGAALLVLAAVCLRFRMRARHRFPDFEVEPRLGGGHAAGVGGVISFASPAVPPATQRDQPPEYLRRA
jgi:hypothetical protein